MKSKPHRIRGRGGRLWKAAGALGITLLLYIAIECGVVLFYDPALDLYPGFSDEIARMNYELYTFDPELIRKMPPHLDVVHPKSKTPMRTNTLGFRGPLFTMEKPAASFRVVFTGDSSVYGFGLFEKDSIPRRIEGLLRKAAPNRTVESINLAVPGYTSFQGVRLMEKYIPLLEPDVVVIGYGFNDSTVRNFTEAEVQASLPSSGSGMLARLLSRSPLFELIVNKVRKSRVKDNIGVHSLVIDKKKGGVSRVPLDEYVDNVRAMVETVEKTGGTAVLLDINLVNYYGDAVLRRIAKEKQIPFLSAREVLERAAPPGGYEPIGSRPEGRAFIIQASVPQWEGAGDPFLARVPLGRVRYPIVDVKLRDDGKGGDLEAGDGIHTCLIEDDGRRDFEFAPAYQIVKVGAQEEAFLNYTTFYRLPDPRDLEPRTLYRSPVIRFNRPSFRRFMVDFDLVHPDAKGADRISRALLPVLLEILEKEK